MAQNTHNQWTRGHGIAALLVLMAMLTAGLLPLQLHLWVWLTIFILLALFAFIVGHGVTGFWYGLLIDSHHKLLLSRLQMILWTLVILSGFLAAALSNIRGGQSEPLQIQMPPELWLLMGISTTSLVSTPLLNGKKAASNGSGAEGEALAAQSSTLEANAPTLRWSDLFQTENGDGNGRLDLSKLQMFFFTLILVIAYGAALAGLFAQSVNKIEALPTLDPGMMLLLGISHIGYLVEQALPGNGKTGSQKHQSLAG